MRRLICISLVLFVSSVAFGGGNFDFGGGPDTLWSTAANWNGDVVPVAADAIGIGGPYGNCVSAAYPVKIDGTVAAVGADMRFGGTENWLSITGGTLDVEDIIGQGGISHTLMSGGAVTCGSIWGGQMPGWNMATSQEWVMTGGTVTITSIGGGEGIYASRDGSASDGVLDFDIQGGTIDATGTLVGFGLTMGTGGTMNINTGGVLKIIDTATARAAIEGWVGSGQITGDGVVGNAWWSDNGDGTLDVTVPEPATMLLLGLGGLLIRRKRA